MKVETRAVLADAYAGKNKNLKGRLLTHAVELDDNDNEIRVLGSNCVRLDSLADAGALDPSDWAKIPTCPKCARKDPRNRR